MKRFVAVAAASLISVTASAQTSLTPSPPLEVPGVNASAPTAVNPPQLPWRPDYTNLVEGKPFDTRGTERTGGKPSFPEQTRAPYHKTAPYKITEITNALHAPWSLAFLPDGKFLVTERLPGALRVIDAQGHIAPPVTGLEALKVTWPETGIYDVALDPKFASNHRIFFVFFAFDHGKAAANQVARATFNEKTNSLSNVKVIYQALPADSPDQRIGVGGRSGGRIAIGKDGYLYVTIGDRDAGTNMPTPVAQTLDNALGKVIRITVDGKPAPGNPYIGRADAKPEIWAIGMRSQEGLAFDEKGQLWSLDHGPRGGDEMNLIKKGGNYGWPLTTHGVDYKGPPMGAGEEWIPGMEEPVYYWSPSVGPSGIAFNKGNLFPDWKDSIFVGTLRGAALVRLGMKDGKVINEEPLLTEVKMRIREVRFGPDGAMYVLTDSGNLSLQDNTPLGSKLLKITPQ